MGRESRTCYNKKNRSKETAWIKNNCWSQCFEVQR